ncbi:MAG TPA: Gfo/Idh/MocA family oxidoreductase [Phycisphaerae bacterium]|nr:Gfo/Idh/MocA family oxidoreductase [Phycisphaerae bacterium]HOJ76085.1 Gfo/Idh/MocA family oxidoreductase [Phycisphaerae bacterium]HOM53420.1 Gfo/Idh/MocA family oxidoreductase [Phycisphaerae bacterium]HON67813.1 Gfo/Idh/MocA family oxidoreductase [Phycisphaerae bacterium]HOQ85033.1 Gfo/Idh/MocA family oxidoreductase [Phycisphaerae bacterium]
MTPSPKASRREFLATSAAAIGAASTFASAARLEPKAGPAPARFKADQTIRVGLIGVGGRCRDLVHATFANPANNVKVVAMADPDQNNVTKMLEQLAKSNAGKPDVYTGEKDWRDKLLARTDVDAVLIAVPCDLHAEMYVATFAAGKHFYGEKPMCIELDEVNAIVAAQERNPDVKCQIGFQRRASSWYQHAIKQIHEGMIGDVFEALGAWRLSGGPLGLPDSGTQIWFGRRQRSGDWMLEQACHTWDVMCWVAQDMPVAAYGVGKRGLFKHIDPERDVTDFYTATLEFPNGMVLDFEHNWMCPQFDEEWKFRGIFERFTGPKGGISLGEYPTDATFYPRDGKDKVIKLAESFPNTTQESVNAFYKALRDGTQPPSNVKNGRMATLTGLLVRKAVYENRRVEMKEILGV